MYHTSGPFASSIKVVIFFIFLGFSFSIPVVSSETALTSELQQKLSLETETIKKWVCKPLIINAVKKHNAETLSIDKILTCDAEWIKNRNIGAKPNALMNRLKNHTVGTWLKQQRKKSGGKYRESFLCDNRGVVVALSNITSDYYQGDEKKWIECFNNGEGKVIYGEPKYDDSADAVLIQISVPVIDKGKTIGVLIVGVKLSSIY